MESSSLQNDDVGVASNYSPPLSAALAADGIGPPQQHARERLFKTDVRFTHYLSMDNSKEVVEFIWLQLFKDILVKMSKTISSRERERAMETMVDHCRTVYHDDPKNLRQIENFEKNYKPSEAISWYTQGGFLYRIINEALRTDDVDILYGFRAYIADLCVSLREAHQQTGTQDISQVFRGTTMPYANVMKLRPGLQIADNAFMSTTAEEDVTQGFAGEGCYGKTSEIVSVVFKIRVAKKTSAIFADIGAKSEIKDEREILFDFGTILEVVSVTFDEFHSAWIVKLDTVSVKNTTNFIKSVARRNPDQALEVLYRRTCEWTNAVFPELVFNGLIDLDRFFSTVSTLDVVRDDGDSSVSNMFKRFILGIRSILPGHEQLNTMATIAAYHVCIQQEGVAKLAPQLTRITPFKLVSRVSHWASNHIFTTSTARDGHGRPIEGSHSVIGTVARTLWNKQ